MISSLKSTLSGTRVSGTLFRKSGGVRLYPGLKTRIFSLGEGVVLKRSRECIHTTMRNRRQQIIRIAHSIAKHVVCDCLCKISEEEKLRIAIDSGVSFEAVHRYCAARIVRERGICVWCKGKRDRVLRRATL